MSDGFDLQQAVEQAQDGVERAGKSLVPWLPDPHQCDCGAYTNATHEYVASQAMYMDIWKCPECGTRYYRDRL